VVISALTIGRNRNDIAHDRKHCSIRGARRSFRLSGHAHGDAADLQDFDAHPRLVGWFDPPCC
jgi:hypothetical protein